MDYDVIIVGAGPGGIFTAYELAKADRALKIGVFELGKPLDKRRCPIDGKKVKSCVKCPTCAIMSGFGGAGAFSDGKYNITNQFGGTLFEYVGKQEAHRPDEVCGRDQPLPRRRRHQALLHRQHQDQDAPALKTACTCSTRTVRHLGTDINYVVLGNIFDELKDKVDFHFNTAVTGVEEDRRRLRGRGRRKCLHLQILRRLRRPQRQQVDGVRLPRAWTSPPTPTASTSACAWNCPRTCSPT